MNTITTRSSRCALCGADNPSGARVCVACGGKLPEAGRGWDQPAFERALLGSTVASGGAVRGVRDWLGAYVETISAVLLRPDRTFRTFRLEGGLAPPVAFLTVVGGGALFLHVLTTPPYLAATTLSWWQIPVFFLAPIVYVYLRAQVVHLVLVLTGRATEAFEVTFRVIAYASASAAVLLLVPVMGEFVFLVAGVWIESIGLSRCHAMPLQAALLAEVIPAAALALTVLAAATMGVLWWSQVAG